MIGRAPRWPIVIMAIVAVIWIIPIVGIVATSLRPLSETSRGWWRLDEFTLTFSAWQRVWDTWPLAPAFVTTAILAAIATVGTMLLTPAAAYAFHFLRFPFRRLLLIIIINAFVLPQQVVVIPLFQLWRDLGLIDSFAAVLIPYVGLSFAWSIYLVKNFLEDFPAELVEASRIDGCGPIQTFLHIVLPNTLNSVFAVGILQFLWTWNALLLPMLYLRSNVPLPVILARINGTYELNWDLQSVAAIITTIVPLAIFLIFQKQFASGADTRTGAKD